METNENENIIVQNLWDVVKMYISRQAYLKKQITLSPKGARKSTANKTQTQKKKKNNKD